jgi:hypothetical protein
VAAHSTVRALYAAYAGALYNVTRSSDNRSTNVGVLEAGGFANVTTHDDFCAKKDCVISNVFDQSPHGNHLGQRWDPPHPPHKLVNASTHRIIVGGGTNVYGMWFDPGYGYNVDKTTGVATGNDEESIYAVMSGTHFNGGCCFDYGNSETRCVGSLPLPMPMPMPMPVPLPLPMYAFAAHLALRVNHSKYPISLHHPLTTPPAAATTAAARWRRSTSATRTGRATRARAAQARGWAPILSRVCTTEAAIRPR